MRGVPEESVRTWRGARQRLSRPAVDLDDALASVLPPVCEASTYASLFARLEEFDPEALHRRVFRERSLRIFPLRRGLPVLVPFESLPALLALRRFADGSRARRSSVQRRIEAQLAADAEALRPSLSGAGAPVDEVRGALAAAQAAKALEWLAARGEVVVGRDPPSLFGRATFAVPRAAEAVRAAPAEGFAFLQDVALLYFRAAGPAARDDFLEWGGLSRSAARHTIEDLVGLIEEVDIEGERKAQFMLDEDAAELREGRAVRTSRAAFLPGLDPAGAASRAGFAPLCEPRLRPKLLPSGRGKPRAVVTLGGTAVATWGWDSALATVAVSAVKELTPSAEESLAEGRERLLAFLEGPLASVEGAPRTLKALVGSL